MGYEVKEISDDYIVVKKMDKRFTLISDYFIKDNLTGNTYTDRDEIVALLNHINEKADKNAELVWEIKTSIDKKINENYPLDR